MSVKIKNEVWKVKWKLKRDYIELILRTVDYRWRVIVIPSTRQRIQTNPS